MEENREKKAQELYMEYKVLEQHIKQMQAQLEALTHQLFELHSTSSSLDEFKKISAGREIFVPLSSGIFAKASINDTSELLVNVGANTVVKKDADSAKKLIQKQMEEIKKIQKHMISELEKMTNHASRIEMQLQAVVS
jgi:prefoldin alpha subunit